MRPTHHLSQTTKREIDELVGESILNPAAPQAFPQLERLSTIETEVAIHRKAINNGFARIEGWVKMMVGIGGGTIVFGFGSVSSPVQYMLVFCVVLLTFIYTVRLQSCYDMPYYLEL
ncbi:unnamed protein product [Tuber aestivum]|uniref:Uncharacterized protein n=1 Tax=Tuber aestivum TaxID=59557 RepID=A0A292QAI9_9PEZI|nr:unnamed protein product [Tuber aestivum]